MNNFNDDNPDPGFEPGPDQMPDTYRFDFSVRWVVQYARHDAEVLIETPGGRRQLVVRRNCASHAQAEHLARQYAENLSAKMRTLLAEQTAALKEAKP